MGVATELREGMENVADALRTLAGAVCTVAAKEHSGTKGEQREFAAVLYSHCESRFGDVLRKLEPRQVEAMTNFIDEMCKGKRK
jgi:hypothetical protein